MGFYWQTYQRAMAAFRTFCTLAALTMTTACRQSQEGALQAMAGPGLTLGKRTIPDDTPPRPAALADSILRRIGIDRPDGSRIVLAEYDEGRDDAARVILIMSAADWAEMRASPPIDQVTSDRFNSNDVLRFSNDHGNGIPEAMTTWLRPKSAFGLASIWRLVSAQPAVARFAFI